MIAALYITSAARAAVANATHEHHQSRPIAGAGR